MRSFLLRWLILALAIAIAAALNGGIEVHGGFLAYMGVAAILGLVNALVRPIVRLFSLPITIVTLGLFSVVINALTLLLAAALSSVLSIENFWDAIVGAIIISIVSTFLNWLLIERPRSRDRR